MKTGLVFNWIVRILILIAMGGGLYFAHIQVKALQVERVRAVAELERTPERLLEAQAQQADLKKYDFDIQRIKTYLITRANVVDVVSRIEQEGSKRGLAIQVPTIEEVIAAATVEGTPKRAGGLLADIEIDVSADGDPGDIIQFAHTVEHLPYLISLDYMSLGNKRRTVVPGSAGSVPSDETATVAPPAGHGEFTFILSVKKDI